MRTAVTLANGQRLRIASKRRYVLAVKGTDGMFRVTKRSDTLATVQAVRRALVPKWGRESLVIVDTTTGEEVASA